MAVKPVYGRFHRPGSLPQLTQGRGWNSPLTGFLLPLARRDYWFKHYDFEEQTINPDWTVSNSGGTSAADFAVVADIEDGILRGDTGTSDNGSIAISYDSSLFDAARNPGMEIRFLVDDATALAFEAGFHDAATNEYALNLNDIDTPTLTSNGVTDTIFVGQDSDQTLKNAAILGKGTTDSVAKTVLGSSPGATILTAATYCTVLVQGRANGGYAIVDGNLAQSGDVSAGPDTAKLMRPYFLVATRSTTAVFPDIDYITLWKERKGV